MKKIFLLAVAIFFALTSTTLAATQNAQKVGVVIIGGVEFKTEDFYKIVKNELKPLSGAEIVVGNDLQTRYKKYWLRKGYIGEQQPEKEDLINFTASSGCKKVVYVIVSDAVVDSRTSAKHRQKDRVSVQLDAYLCTTTDVVDVFAASDEQNSKGSALRARRGAFKKSFVEISKTLSNYI